MLVKEALKKYRNIEIDLLLAHILKKSREFLLVESNCELTRKETSELTRMVLRRLQGEPIAYILGYKYFFGRKFLVSSDVLIPRPETEWIVSRIMNYEFRIMNGDKKHLSLLDVGTGSGCISISLAKEFSMINLPERSLRQFSITATDISSKALAVAKKNAKIILSKKSNSRDYDTTIRFKQSDLLEEVHGKFDIIVANLPYVPRKSYELGIKNLEWEPKSALVSKVNDFDIFERFLKAVGSHLNPKSVILLEIDPLTKPYISKWIKKYLQNSKLKFHKDLNSLWRFAEIKQK